jgi:hypothetical protein
MATPSALDLTSAHAEKLRQRETERLRQFEATEMQKYEQEQQTPKPAPVASPEADPTAPGNAIEEGVGGLMVAAGNVAGAAGTMVGAAVTDPLALGRALSAGGEAGKKAALDTATSGFKKLGAGLWSAVTEGPGRVSAGDVVEGLIEIAISPLTAPLAAVANFGQGTYESLAPEERERIVLAGGRGSAPSAIRRLFNVPHQVGEGIRTGNWNPTPEQAESLDAPMTAGELLNVTLSVAIPAVAARVRGTVGFPEAARRGSYRCS